METTFAEVWHVKEEVYLTWIGKMGPKLEFPADYELVARVSSDDPEQVFQLTNHVDKDWGTNAEVELVKRSRSTSIGDVIVMTDGIYQVSVCGFEKHLHGKHTFTMKPF